MQLDNQSPRREECRPAPSAPSLDVAWIVLSVAFAISIRIPTIEAARLVNEQRNSLA